jgi:hypothetical protein
MRFLDSILSFAALLPLGMRTIVICSENLNILTSRSVSTAPTADAAVAYTDPETGFTFASYNAAYTLSKSIAFRVAVPSDASRVSSYDAVLQVVAPLDVGWAGLAWGGSMVNNPLTVSYANGNSATISSRYAT